MREIIAVGTVVGMFLGVVIHVQVGFYGLLRLAMTTCQGLGVAPRMLKVRVIYEVQRYNIYKVS